MSPVVHDSLWPVYISRSVLMFHIKSSMLSFWACSFRNGPGVRELQFKAGQRITFLHSEFIMRWGVVYF